MSTVLRKVQSWIMHLIRTLFDF